MRNFTKQFVLFITLLTLATEVNAQVKIGENPTTINKASLLELEGANKGLLFPRVNLTDKAKELILTLKKDHGNLMFHQSGGCCDGSQPMCFQKGEFYLGSSDVCLGEIEDCEFWMSKDQFEYWQYTHLACP